MVSNGENWCSQTGWVWYVLVEREINMKFQKESPWGISYCVIGEEFGH